MSQDFFEELQGEFLDESAFLLEQYEEAMLELENGEAAEETLAQIFRVAHSIKGGAAAVGFTDLNKFAHVAEDLLAFLRLYSYLISPDIISLLLKSGDALKNRVQSLKQNKNSPWDVTDLQSQLVDKLQKLNQQIGQTYENPISSDSKTKPIDLIDAIPSSHTQEIKETVTISPQISIPTANSTSPSAGEDLTNYDLLAEIEAQFQNSKINNEERAQEPSFQENNSIINSKSESLNTGTTPPNTTSGASKPKPSSHGASSGSIKIDVGRVDSVLDTVGEIVVLKNQLLHDEGIKNSSSPRLASIVDQIDKLVRDLYDRSLAMRLTPLKSMFIKIQRIVRDVSLQLGKDVDLQLIGEETEVERTVFELLTDPMVHLVRNALDHGIELPSQRVSKGKNPKAKLLVSARQQGGNVIIDIQDDGCGINRDKVLNKAIDKNLLPPGKDPQNLSDDEVFQLLFLPGFSTADKVTDLSGRGVGLDVVKSNLEKARGKLEIFSTPEKGSTFRLSIPLSTAITDGIIFTINSQNYILPIYSIREIVRLTTKDITEIANIGSVIKVREQLIPIIDCQDLFECKKLSSSTENLNLLFLILESVQGLAALPVNQIVGQAQVVVKPAHVGNPIPEVSGAAILGDGKTVLILDPQSLINKMPKESMVA